MTDPRRIGILDLPNLTPAVITGRPLPMLEWLDVDDLWIDPAYQRDIGSASLKLIARLVEGWDWMKLAPILVALTPNGFEVVDGQNRATAAKLHPQVVKVPCYVVDGSTLEQRADAFVSHARNRVAVTPGQIFRAEVTSGDEDALAVETVCCAAGVRILPFSSPFGVPYQIGDTTSLSSIRRMLKRRGPEKTGAVLRGLVAAGLAPIPANLIRAAEALCCEPEYAGDFGPEHLTAALQSLGTSAVGEAKALAVAKGLPIWRAWVAVLFKNRRARPKLVEPVESAEPSMPAVRRRSRGEVPANLAEVDRFLPVSRSDPIVSRFVDPRTGTVPLGDPPPGRSALDQRRAGT